MKTVESVMGDATEACGSVVSEWAAVLRARRLCLVDDAIAQIRASIPHVDHAGPGWVEAVGALIGAGIDHFLDLWCEAGAGEVPDLTRHVLVPSDAHVRADVLRIGYRIVCDVVREHLDELTDDPRGTHGPAAVLAARAAARSVEQALAASVDQRCATLTAAAAHHRSTHDARIVRALLDTPVQYGTAVRLALEVGVDLQQPLRVCAARGDGSLRELASRLRDEVRRQHGDAITAVWDDHVVVLLADADDRIPSGAAHIGVSRVTAPNDLRCGHVDAIAALRVAVDEGAPVSRFEDRLLDHLLARALPLDELAEERLAPLADLDTSDRERVLATLEAYLDANCSVTAAGERLHLHRESVRYRLRQIKKLWGSVLDTAEGRLTLHLAVKVALRGGHRS